MILIDSAVHVHPLFNQTEYTVGRPARGVKNGQSVYKEFVLQARLITASIDIID